MNLLAIFYKCACVWHETMGRVKVGQCKSPFAVTVTKPDGRSHVDQYIISV